MASRNQIRKFVHYCIENKSADRLREDFYKTLSINYKECKEFGLSGDEWRYCIRTALRKKEHPDG
jgi:hypothetical protein